MKTLLKSIIGGTSLALLVGTAFAQSSSDSTRSGSSSLSGSSQTTTASQANQTQVQFFQAKNILGEKVKNSQDQSLGSIKDLVFNPQNGQMFAALDTSGGRYALVPWQALTITPTGKNKEDISLNTTKDALQSGPTVAKDQWDELNNPTFVQGIYSHYNLQPPTSVGGGFGTGTSGSTSGSSSSALPSDKSQK